MPNRSKGIAVRLSWWHWVFGVDLFLVLITVLKKCSLHFPGKAWLASNFNLAVERNYAVWWSSVTLLAVALIAWEIFCCKGRRAKFAWIVLAVVLAGLSLDEMGSIHERIGSWSDLLPFGLVLVTLVVYALASLFRNEETRRSAIFIGAAFLVFGSVAFQEYLGDTGIWPDWATGIRQGVEEGAELMGGFLLLWGMIPQRSLNMQDAMDPVIPNPFFMEKISFVVLAGLIFHSTASILLLDLVDIAQTGNPLVWYPASVFFLLFAGCYWVSGGREVERRIVWLLLAMLFLMCSAGVLLKPSRLPGFGRFVVTEYEGSAFYVSCVLVLTCVCSFIPKFLRERLGCFLLLLSLALLIQVISIPSLGYLCSGVFVYVLFVSFWSTSPGWKGNTPRVLSSPKWSKAETADEN